MSDPTSPDVDLAGLANRLRLALVPLVRQLRQQDEPDLTASQASALATVSTRPLLTIGELARVERVTSPMITKITKGLEELGLLERTTDPADRRVTLLQTTAEGARRLERRRSRKTAWLAKRLRDLDPAEVAALEFAIPVFEHLAGESR